MHDYFLLNLSELAVRRAIIMREEAQLWDIFARDLKREAARREEIKVRRSTPAPVPAQPSSSGDADDRKLFVRVAEAAKMMGIGRSSLYEEISASRLKVRKSGKKTLIAVADIQAWFDALPRENV